jgi:thiol-disulfide isomerase/thioredoxin/quercetin dioxygenase-like cupin family protein
MEDLSVHAHLESETESVHLGGNADPRTELKPWGSYTDVARGDNFVVRMLIIKAGERTSLHRHTDRGELWQCVKGEPKVLVCEGPDKISSVPFVSFAPGEATRVRTGHIHRIDNRNGKEDAHILEIQFGKCGEADVERFLDDYGRSVSEIPKPVVRKAKNDQEAKDLIGAKQVIVKFTAAWCGPCKMIAPKFQEIATAEDDLRFVEVDVDICEAFAMEHSVTSMPTFVGFLNGAEVGRSSGAVASGIQSLVDKVKEAKRTSGR